MRRSPINLPLTLARYVYLKQMIQKVINFFSIFIAVSPWIISSQTTAPKVYSTSEISSLEAPKIDGFINDIIWNKVPWGTNFIEVSPDENTNPSEQTKFKILTTKNIYISHFWP